MEAVDVLLSGIGVPEPQPFVPDEFQVEALKAIETQDVLVTAPTGSGKTSIAPKKSAVSSPMASVPGTQRRLKPSRIRNTLSFHWSSAEIVGILTGDRKENTEAPLIVGTTEIFRNQLFDALRQSEQVRTDFVIIDEAHYLADEDRGHVWEETIILTPPRIRMLLLSATVGAGR